MTIVLTLGVLFWIAIIAIIVVVLLRKETLGWLYALLFAAVVLLGIAEFGVRLGR